MIASKPCPAGDSDLIIAQAIAPRLGSIPFFAFPPAVRKLIYTTNAIESLHSQLRKIIKTRGHFPSDDAATKLIWLALRNIGRDSGRSVREWREAMNQLAIAYGDRFTRLVA
jgi:transposase-like protein